MMIKDRCRYSATKQKLPEGVIFQVRLADGSYDRAYVENGKWKLMHNDKEIDVTGIRMRKGIADALDSYPNWFSPL